MRVPTNSNNELMLGRISDLSVLQSKLQSQVSTGQRIFNPEDDPASMGRILTLDNESRQLSQYNSNMSYALDLSNATYSALNSIKSISDRAGEIATLGTSTGTAGSNQAYASEVNQEIEQLVQLGNSTFQNNSLFSGTAVSTPAFSATRDASGNVTGVTYQGQTNVANVITVPISSSSNIAPGSDNTTNQGIGTFINTLVSLRNALQAGDTTTVQSLRSSLTNSEDMLVSAISDVGAVQTRIQVAQAQNKDRTNNISTLMAGEAEVSMPEAITRLSQTNQSYQAALQSTSLIMRTSLMDYIPNA